MKTGYRVLIAVSVVICLVFGLLATAAYRINDPNKEIPLGFFEEKTDSLDGVVIGTSGAFRFWIPTEAYLNHGAAIGLYASHSLPLVVMKHMAVAVLENQHPKFIAIEVRNASKDLKSRKTEYITDLTDHMPATKTRLKLIMDIIKFDIKNDTGISKDPRKYKYPSTEEDIASAEAYRYNYSVYKGFRVFGPSFKSTEFRDPTEWTTEAGTVPYGNDEYMKELLDYCDTLDCDVIFFSSPGAFSVKRQKAVNGALKMAKDRGYRTRNFSVDDGLEKIGLSEKDYNDDRHTNVYGAIKFTEYMYRYFDSIYDFEDHRGDSAYKSWDESAELFRHDVKEKDPKISFKSVLR